MFVLLAALASVAVGCDRIELLGSLRGDGGAGESSGSGGSGFGGGEGGAPAVEEPAIVAALSDPNARDTDPTFTEDLLEVYFMSDRSGDKEIWRSRRPDRESDWSPPEPVSELDTAGQEENPHVSNDGRDIWFFSDRDRSQADIWHASRATRGDAFGQPEPVPELTTGAGSSTVEVAVDPSRTLFVLSSKRSGNQPYQLYRIDRDGPDGAFGEPLLLEAVVSEADEFDPDLRRAGRFLAFDSRRDGHGEIYWTWRSGDAAPFRAAEPVAALSSPFEDGAPAFSEDLDYALFSSDRSGNVEIYEAKLVPPL